MSPSTTALKIGANSCEDAYFTMTKTSDAFGGKLKVTASSGDNSDSRTIDVKTTSRDVVQDNSPPLGLIVFVGVVIFVIVIYTYNHFRKESSQTKSLLFCQKCGAGVSKDVKFCKKCGKKLG